MQGDDLDVKIRKGEREVRALENTLQMMDGRNGKLKQSLRRVDGDSDEEQRIERLKTQVQLATRVCQAVPSFTVDVVRNGHGSVQTQAS